MPARRAGSGDSCKSRTDQGGRPRPSVTPRSPRARRHWPLPRNPRALAEPVRICWRRECRRSRSGKGPSLAAGYTAPSRDRRRPAGVTAGLGFITLIAALAARAVTAGLTEVAAPWGAVGRRRPTLHDPRQSAAGARDDQRRRGRWLASARGAGLSFLQRRGQRPLAPHRRSAERRGRARRHGYRRKPGVLDRQRAVGPRHRRHHLHARVDLGVGHVEVDFDLDPVAIAHHRSRQHEGPGFGDHVNVASLRDLGHALATRLQNNVEVLVTGNTLHTLGRVSSRVGQGHGRILSQLHRLPIR